MVCDWRKLGFYASFFVVIVPFFDLLPSPLEPSIEKAASSEFDSTRLAKVDAVALRHSLVVSVIPMVWPTRVIVVPRPKREVVSVSINFRGAVSVVTSVAAVTGVVAMDSGHRDVGVTVTKTRGTEVSWVAIWRSELKAKSTATDG